MSQHMEPAAGENGAQNAGETGAHAHKNDSQRGAEGKGEDYSTSQAIRTLAEAVQEIRKDMKSLKRKQEIEDETPSKKTCTDTSNSPQASTSQSPDQISESEDSEDELENFMEEGAKDMEQTETLSDLEDFFQPDDGTGECLTDKMARITEQALRGKKSTKDEEKLKDLREKYKRPKNIENLQVPTVDEFAWRQMKREVKRVDYALKKGVFDCAQAITPLAKALEVMQGNNDPVTAKGYVMDAFKILCLTVKSTNIKRQELIKREIQPKYRDLCAEQPSATKLLGDNFLESVKKLDGTKTQLTITPQNFLGKRGGDRHQSSFHSYNNNNNNYRRNFNQGHQGGKFQPSQRGKYPYSNNRNHKSKNPHLTRK